jgi:NAD(P)-dependent dehydrogenase (short-subunit alcohol dehydrogenase family)
VQPLAGKVAIVTGASKGLGRVFACRMKPGADTAMTRGPLSIRNLPLVWEVAR